MSRRDSTGRAASGGSGRVPLRQKVIVILIVLVLVLSGFVVVLQNLL